VARAVVVTTGTQSGNRQIIVRRNRVIVNFRGEASGERLAVRSGIVRWLPTSSRRRDQTRHKPAKSAIHLPTPTVGKQDIALGVWKGDTKGINETLDNPDKPDIEPVANGTHLAATCTCRRRGCPSNRNTVTRHGSWGHRNWATASRITTPTRKACSTARRTSGKECFSSNRNTRMYSRVPSPARSSSRRRRSVAKHSGNSQPASGFK